MARLFLAAGAAVLVAAAPPWGSQDLSFDRFLDRLQASAPGLRGLAVEQYVALLGRTPIIEGETAIFLVEGDGKHAPRIEGDFTRGGESGAPVADGLMAPIEGANWYYLKLAVRPDARLLYRIELGDERRTDPRNPRRATSFGVEMSELRMPAYRPPREVLPDATIPAGRVETTGFTSRVLGNARKVHVYLPPAYLASTDRYPVAYVGDGTLYLEQGRLAQVLDHAIVETAVRPLIAVLVDPVDRGEEYGASADYRRFFVEELVPFVDGAYRTIDDPAARVVIGSSRGGLAAVDLAFNHPALFGFVVALSPAVHPIDLTGAIERGAQLPIRFYVLGALYDGEWLPDARRLRDALSRKGYDVVYAEVPEGHDIFTWRARIDDALAAFLPGG